MMQPTHTYTKVSAANLHADGGTYGLKVGWLFGGEEKGS